MNRLFKPNMGNAYRAIKRLDYLKMYIFLTNRRYGNISNRCYIKFTGDAYKDIRMNLK